MFRNVALEVQIQSNTLVPRKQKFGMPQSQILRKCNEKPFGLAAGENVHLSLREFVGLTASS